MIEAAKQLALENSRKTTTQKSARSYTRSRTQYKKRRRPHSPAKLPSALALVHQRIAVRSAGRHAGDHSLCVLRDVHVAKGCSLRDKLGFRATRLREGKMERLSRSIVELQNQRAGSEQVSTSNMKLRIVIMASSALSCKRPCE